MPGSRLLSSVSLPVYIIIESCIFPKFIPTTKPLARFGSAEEEGGVGSERGRPPDFYSSKARGKGATTYPPARKKKVDSTIQRSSNMVVTRAQRSGRVSLRNLLLLLQ